MPISPSQTNFIRAAISDFDIKSTTASHVEKNCQCLALLLAPQPLDSGETGKEGGERKGEI